MNHLNFGAWIRWHREKHGATVRGLARLCGLASSHISEIEGGRHVPSVRVATLLALHLKMDRDEVLLRAGHVPPDIVTLLKEQPHLCAFLRQQAAHEASVQ